MTETDDLEFDKGHPKELDGEVVTEDEFKEIKSQLDLDENIRMGKRPWDAPPGKVKIWVVEDDEEE